jgi:hypothetical protein
MLTSDVIGGDACLSLFQLKAADDSMMKTLRDFGC